MTTPKPRSRKFVCLLRWSSIGRASARSNINPSAQIVPESSPFIAASRLFLTCFPAAQHSGACCRRSHSTSSAIKPP